MAFFEYVPEDQLAPEAKEYIEILKKRARSDRIEPIFYAYAQHPRLLKAWVQAVQEFLPIPNRFKGASHIAGMLISHAKRYHACFKASRKVLAALGFDEPALNTMCQAPAALPLPERERRVVGFTLRVALDAGGLKADDFREMERAGFSKEELLEMVGIAAYWNMATTLASAADAGLADG